MFATRDVGVRRRAPAASLAGTPPSGIILGVSVCESIWSDLICYNQFN